LGEVLARYNQILIPEWNLGQLRSLINQQFTVDAQGLNKVQGKPFTVGEVLEAIYART
jgi:2-oxoglutarate ferredoxin oxidoreductase subunit alpha